MIEAFNIGNAELYCGDCREILDKINANVVITDPPYGVNYKGSSTKHTKDLVNQYNWFVDTPENVKDICVPIIESLIKSIGRVVMTPGIKCSRLYPQPDGEGCIFYPAGANRGPWGFITHQPIYYYGKCPYLSVGLGSRPTGFISYEAAEKNGHPCPKPIKQMEWLVNRGSFLNEIVFDPFMGSGTTGVACVTMGRKFIGVEVEKKYFDIACERIELAQSQKRLFA